MAREDFRFSTSFRVRYADVDAQGVVYNAHYLTYFDIGITEYLRGLGLTPNLESARCIDPQLVAAALQWKAPVLLDEVIDIRIRVARVGRTSLTFRGEIHPAGPEGLRCSAEITWVNVDQRSRKAVPMDTGLIDGILRHEGKPL